MDELLYNSPAYEKSETTLPYIDFSETRKARDKTIQRGCRCRTSLECCLIATIVGTIAVVATTFVILYCGGIIGTKLGNENVAHLARFGAEAFPDSSTTTVKPSPDEIATARYWFIVKRIGEIVL